MNFDLKILFSTTYENGIIFFGENITGGGCSSSLGKAPGYISSDTRKIVLKYLFYSLKILLLTMQSFIFLTLTLAAGLSEDYRPTRARF